MPNDAKLGLVVGLGLVITIAVIFFRKDLITRKPTADPTAASTNSPVKRFPPAAPRGMSRPARAKTTAHTEAPGAHHVVQEGESNPEH